jgi:hypothetical protein
MMRAAATMACVLALPPSALAFGNVDVTVVDGQLRAVGDESPNALSITAGIGPGAYVVTGLDDTAVNGGLSIMVTDVSKMMIEMREGADRVEISRIELDKALVVKLGADDDVFVLTGGRIKGKADVKGAKGSDDLRILGSARFGAKLFVGGGKAGDVIRLTDLSISGGLEIEGAGGNDDVALQTVRVEGDEAATIFSGNGYDAVALVDSDFGGDVDVALGDQDDHLRIDGCDFDAGVTAAGGDGDDDELDLGDDNDFEPGEQREVSGFEDLD